MKMPFEWVVGDSSKGLHGDRAHVYDGGGAVTVNYTTLRGTTRDFGALLGRTPVDRCGLGGLFPGFAATHMSCRHGSLLAPGNRRAMTPARVRGGPSACRPQRTERQ